MPTLLLRHLLFRVLTVLPFLGIGFLIEEVLRKGRRLPASFAFNLSYAPILWGLQFILTGVLTAAVIRTVACLPGAGLIAIAPPTDIVTTVVLVALLLVLRDFFFYWYHRCQHASRWLWAEHEVHHSDEAMNVTTSHRHHWLEGLLETIGVTAPFAYIFNLPMSLAVMTSLAAEGIGYFVHLDAPLSFGGCLGSPAYHRIHHSRLPEHYDKNFAALCPLWDRLFNTYHRPSLDRIPTGLTGPPILTMWQAIAWPFRRWHQMMAERDQAPALDPGRIEPSGQGLTPPQRLRCAPNSSNAIRFTFRKSLSCSVNSHGTDGISSRGAVDQAVGLWQHGHTIGITPAER